MAKISKTFKLRKNRKRHNTKRIKKNARTRRIKRHKRNKTKKGGSEFKSRDVRNLINLDTYNNVKRDKPMIELLDGTSNKGQIPNYINLEHIINLLKLSTRGDVFKYLDLMTIEEFIRLFPNSKDDEERFESFVKNFRHSDPKKKQAKLGKITNRFGFGKHSLNLYEFMKEVFKDIDGIFPQNYEVNSSSSSNNSISSNSNTKNGKIGINKFKFRMLKYFFVKSYTNLKKSGRGSSNIDLSYLKRNGKGKQLTEIEKVLKKHFNFGSLSDMKKHKTKYISERSIKNNEKKNINKFFDSNYNLYLYGKLRRRSMKDTKNIVDSQVTATKIKNKFISLKYRHDLDFLYNFITMNYKKDTVNKDSLGLFIEYFVGQDGEQIFYDDFDEYERGELVCKDACVIFNKVSEDVVTCGICNDDKERMDISEINSEVKVEDDDDDDEVVSLLDKTMNI